MSKFWVDLPSEITLELEKAAPEFRARGAFPAKHYGKKALAEFILTEWVILRVTQSAPTPKGRPLTLKRRQELLAELKNQNRKAGLP